MTAQIGYASRLASLVGYPNRFCIPELDCLYLGPLRTAPSPRTASLPSPCIERPYLLCVTLARSMGYIWVGGERVLASLKSLWNPRPSTHNLLLDQKLPGLNIYKSLSHVRLVCKGCSAFPFAALILVVSTSSAFLCS